MEITVTYQDKKGGNLSGSVLNISLGGAYVQTGNPLAKGVMAILELQDAFRGTLVKISGKVVRSDDSRGMALEFVDKNHEGVRRLITGIRRSEVREALAPGRSDHRADARVNVSSKTAQMTKR